MRGRSLFLGFMLIHLALVSFSGHALGGEKREFAGFGGIGFGLGQSSLKSDNAGTANFRSSGYLLEAGFTFPMGVGTYGIQLSGEYGQSNAINTLSSETYKETGTLSYYSGKLGFFLGSITLGGGYRSNEVSIESLSTETDGYTKTKYSGPSTFAFGNVSLDFQKRYRGAFEVQYLNGSLKPSGESASDVKLGEISVSLRAYMLFD